MDTSKTMVYFALALVIIAPIFIQDSHGQGTCSMLTCDECISAKYTCAWCSQKNFTSPRCGTRNDLETAGCEHSSIEYPAPTIKSVLEDETVRDSHSNGQRAFQIQPQRMKIQIRPRSKTSHTVTFRAANNYPVDLYFLYDSSVSMEKAIVNLAKLTADIGKAIGDISRNYQMGYGIFQDKTTLPFTDMSPKRMANPCFSISRQCDPPFEFRHVLNMTKDLNTFQERVKQTNLSANIDHPEGSLDGLMQASTCQSKLGWRGVSRKMLIFASNDRFHTAGDGRFGGILAPNDGHCHLTSEGFYSKELKQDYPSVSQLTQAVLDNEMHVIFIVPDELLDLFGKLSNRVPQSTVGKLGDENDPDNKNIRNVIAEKYKEMISEVEIVHNNLTGVEVKIAAISKECKEKGTSKCAGLEIGKKIDFSLEIIVTSCPAKKEDRKKQLILHPKSLKNDKLIIDLEIICECGCTSDTDGWDVSKDVCTNGNGTIKCGICDCNEDRFGSKCECDVTEEYTGDNQEELNCVMKNDNSSTPLPCTGHGSCKCGQCTCDEGFSGEYCQCNDKKCKTYQRELCGGIRGYCVCGECVCEEGYTGEACRCPTSNTTCMKDGQLCSGNGACDCGVCKCKTGYTGKFCEECFLCGEGVCDIQDYRACAECLLAEKIVEKCKSECISVKAELVDSLSPDAGSNDCALMQSDDCFLKYTTKIKDNNVTLFVQRTKVCPEPVDIIPIVAGVVAGVVLCGILLLVLWKILTTVYDKIEYSKFQEDLQNCKWAKQDNPVYKGATTTYKNPLADAATFQE